MGILPTKKRSPVIDLRTLNVLVYGQPGVGKSTLASQAPDSLFFATEDGVKTLEVFEHPCRDWKALEDGVQELIEIHKKPERPFRSVVIDTIDNMVLFASQKVCGDNKWDHESDGGYGKGFGLLNRTIKETLLKISNLRDSEGSPSFGLWMISHSKEVELEDRGRKWMKTVPSLSDSQRKIIEGFADLILYADVVWDEETQTHQRIVHTKPSRFYVAKDRTGHLPETITLSLESPTGYDRILQALQEAVPGKASPSNGTSSSRPPKREEPQEDPVSPEPETSPEPPPPDAPSQEEPPLEPPTEPQDERPEPPKEAIKIWDSLDKVEGYEGDDKKKKTFLTRKLRSFFDDKEAQWTREWLIRAHEDGGMHYAWGVLRKAVQQEEMKSKVKGGKS